MEYVLVEYKNILRFLARVLSEAGLEAKWEDFDKDMPMKSISPSWINVYNKPYEKLGFSLSPSSIPGPLGPFMDRETGEEFILNAVKAVYRFHVTCRPSEDLNVKLRVLKKGIFKKEIVGFVWEGGGLSETLNCDDAIYEFLSGDLEVEVKVVKDGAEIIIARNTVMCTPMKFKFIPTKLYVGLVPPLQELMIAEKVAEHIKRMVR